MNPSTNDKTIQSKRDYWQAHVESWKNSKLKQEAYCLQAGIRYSTFVYWKGYLKDKAPEQVKENFLPVKVAPHKSIPPEVAPRAIQVKLLSGHVVYIPVTMNVNDIGRLIQLMGEAHA